MKTRVTLEIDHDGTTDVAAAAASRAWSMNGVRHVEVLPDPADGAVGREADIAAAATYVRRLRGLIYGEIGTDDHQRGAYLLAIVAGVLDDRLRAAPTPDAPDIWRLLARDVADNWRAIDRALQYRLLNVRADDAVDQLTTWRGVRRAWASMHVRATQALNVPVEGEALDLLAVPA